MDVEMVQLHDNVKFTKLLRVPRMKHLPCFLLILLLSLNEIPFQGLALSSFSSALVFNCEHGHVFHRIHDGARPGIVL